MQGWNIKYGNIINHYADEEEYWKLFNYVFSNQSKKTTTYKFGLIKSIIDNIFNCVDEKENRRLYYSNLFSNFTQNYWNLVIKYNINQMSYNGKTKYSGIEKILFDELSNNPLFSNIEFEAIDEFAKKNIVIKVTNQCKKYVLGALYNDFNGCFYSFNLQDEYITIAENMYQFILKYKKQIEELNYFHWAKFLEQNNDENTVSKLLSKLELSTPKRSDLSIYRKILNIEFNQSNCFYCGKKLNSIHVDHVIPWTFIKDDRLWNFVLACPECNNKKSDKLPNIEFIEKLIERNEKISNINNHIIEQDFKYYNQKILKKIYIYAKNCGYKTEKTTN